jgi:outer membrane cobalamin receptor
LFGADFLEGYDDFDYILGNPALGPEYQQGGEGGLEVYVNGIGSLVVTRYNQTVDHLISTVRGLDTVRSNIAWPIFADFYDSDGIGYVLQNQFLNVASIRNQGWELQGNANAGPLALRTTYSWTKSRTIGVDPRYRSLFTAASYPQLQPGATFRYLPEHSWAVGVTYTRAGSTVALNMTGVGRVTNDGDDFYFRNFSSGIRLRQNLLRLDGGAGYMSSNAAYSIADLNASHRFATRVEGVLQVQNLADRYRNDLYARYPTMGRQTKMGIRARF